MTDLADEIGKALRRVRLARGLTLRQVFRLSEGSFKATSLAGYERGERTISVERFCDVCELYGVAPELVLGEIVREVRGKVEPEIDLTQLEVMGSAESTLVSGFVRQIRAQRREAPSVKIVLRDADLDVLATAAGTTRAELAEALEPAIHRKD